MKRRSFLKTSAAGSMVFMLPGTVSAFSSSKKIRIAQIGLGMMGVSDLNSIASHPNAEIVALCDVDMNLVDKVKDRFPQAKVFADYKELFRSMGKDIDAVVVSTTDHAHAPISLMAMNMNKHVYCQKPLTHYISESREMDALAAKKKLITQMGIQVHSFYDYKLATILIRGGIIGKVKKVIAWSPKVWGYDGAAPTGADPVPTGLNWDLWLGDAKKRPYKKGLYHQGNWRKCIDYGCGTLGDMGVHIFDTPYNALKLGVPLTVKNNCRKPNDFGHPEKNHVQYIFPGTPYTSKSLEWVWYDGIGAPALQEDLMLPNGDKLPDQGAMFIGEDGRRLLLPHFMQLPKLIIEDAYQTIDIAKFDTKGEAGKPTVSYDVEGEKHYHEFVDACLGKAKCSAPFSYAAKLTEVILLGVIAARFPGKTLNWDGKKARFKEASANKFLKGGMGKV
ncbi:MAG TPA: Gfo/Idh/MocA family oxidoreductase [Niabella sp.]|nr:Gfo/Idh/MocA family oxidoreductase [Niabella sp.]HOZ97481.1 Gfo/Idh/MocA family oxidoreductase [Niabella sp.]HQW15569.1 Gfo/Idh/MocA family oxidoreductase [Niabella sp.]HQX20712.1 Gfo/Idh/MocA family oxidoreductase [Niabella sp.]HQX40934.1 Gfo/Idh/MocA family oxidoreductase [Niabella sp.]